METQVATREQQWSEPNTSSTAVATVEHRPVGLVDLGQFKTAAEVFIKSGYFDSALGKTSPEVMVARAQVKLAIGAEIGLPPFLSLQGIYWLEIPGQAPSLMKGAAVCAYVMGRSAKYRYTTIKESKEEVSILFEEYRDGAWAPIYTSTYTMEMAKVAGLAGKKNWLANPVGMMWKRAMTNGTNKVAADEINGPAGEPDEAVWEPVEGNDDKPQPLIPETVEATPNVAAKTPPEIAADDATPTAATNEPTPKAKRGTKATKNVDATASESVVTPADAPVDIVDDMVGGEDDIADEGFSKPTYSQEKGSITKETLARVNAYRRADATGLTVTNLVKAKGWKLSGTADLSEYQAQVIIAVCEGRDESDVMAP
jgi:hypothetical protein